MLGDVRCNTRVGAYLVGKQVQLPLKLNRLARHAAPIRMRPAPFANPILGQVVGQDSDSFQRLRVVLIEVLSHVSPLSCYGWMDGLCMLAGREFVQPIDFSKRHAAVRKRLADALGRRHKLVC